MKKRIIAILLSLSIMVGVLSFSKRSYAAPAAVAGVVGIGTLAWEILDLITGKDAPIIDGIRTFIESGVDGLTNPDSAFQQSWSGFWSDWADGWGIMCDTISGWFDSGDIKEVDGKVKLSKEQIAELYSQCISVMRKPSGLQLTCGYSYQFLAADITSPILIKDLPQISEFMSGHGQSFAAVYYNDNTLVFPSVYFTLSINRSGSCTPAMRSVKVNGTRYSMNSLFSLSSSFDNLANNKLLCFDYPIYNLMEYKYDTNTKTANIDNCFVYTDGTLTFKPITSVNFSGLQSGLITTTYDYPDFLESISDCAVDAGALADVADPSLVLPDESSLSVPVNPDLDVPLSDQIMVTDLPLTDDVPLSELDEEFGLGIDTPSVILTKFPFCIPYDFVRIIGVLASDPVPPVFHIPISTHPSNLSGWSTNETVGKYVSNDDPMFEINEEIVIDFANIPLVQPICYTCFIVGFVILLIHITPKMIQH